MTSLIEILTDEDMKKVRAEIVTLLIAEAEKEIDESKCYLIDLDSLSSDLYEHAKYKLEGLFDNYLSEHKDEIIKTSLAKMLGGSK